MAEVLCVYREVAVLRESEAVQPNVTIISYDEKPGIPAISSTAPDLPPQSGFHAGWARDHEYKRHGKLSLLAGIDLLTGKVHARVENRHRSREFVGFLKMLDAAYPTGTAIKADPRQPLRAHLHDAPPSMILEKDTGWRTGPGRPLFAPSLANSMPGLPLALIATPATPSPHSSAIWGGGVMNVTTTARLRNIQRVSVGMLLLTGAVNYVDRVALAIANPLIRQDLHLSIAEMGLLLSMFLWTYCFAQLPVGFAIDRVGPRLLLGLGAVIWSVAQILAGFVTSMGQFALTRVLLGLGEAPQFPLNAMVVRSWFNVRDRGTPTGIFNSASTLGPAIAPPLLTFLMLTFGWRSMFIIVGVFGVVVGLVWWAIYRDPKDHNLSADERNYLEDGEDRTHGERVTFAEWRSLFRYRTTWGMIFGNFGSGYMIWLYAAWLPGYLEIQRHISIPHAGWIAAIPHLFGVVGSLFGGWLADRLMRAGLSPINSRKLPLIFGMFGSAACTIFAARTPSNTAAVAAISAAVFTGNLAGATIWALAVVAAPSKGVASLGSMQNFGGFLGGALAPMLTGFIVQEEHSFVPALILSAVVSILSAIVYLVVVRDPIGLDAREPVVALA
jgi:sugar phosphate permease